MSEADARPAHQIITQGVEIPAGEALLQGDMTIPSGARGIVAFAHGSGSGRHSPRNKAVAEALVSRGMATLLLDLLTPAEEAIDPQTAQHRFDIPLLASRVVSVADWLGTQPETGRLRIGVFGASTGAAAALIAAAERVGSIRAVVSRGGRPDLAGDFLPRVRVPTLLIVGGEDGQVIQINRQAASHMRAQVEVVVVPGATHLFEEPGALELVARLAGDWFTRYLGSDSMTATSERSS